MAEPISIEVEELAGAFFHVKAKAGEKTVGQMGCRLQNKGGKLQLRVTAFEVDKEYRRRGIGTMMMNRLHNVARKSGVSAILVPVVWGESAGFYKKLGMRDRFSFSFSEKVQKNTKPVPEHLGFFTATALRRLRGRMKK